MFMSDDPLLWPNVVSTSAMPKSEVLALEQGGWWRPMRGFLVAPRDKESSSRQKDYHLGYVGALAQQYSQGVIFAGTTAAMLLGHPVWPERAVIDVYKCDGRREVRTLHAHPYSGTPVWMRPMRRPVSLSGVVDLGGGMLVTGRDRTAVDVARLASSQSAFVAVCSILGVLATSGDRYRDRNEAAFYGREAAARARIAMMAENLSNTEGRQRAMQIISLVSGQVESVAEARVLWIICAYGLPMPLMQYRIVVEGREFFGDFVWPEAKLIVEFNGEGKYGSAGVRERRMAAERARESLLRSAGYEVLNLSWAQLDDHRRTALLIHRHLNPDAVDDAAASFQIKRELFRPARAFRVDSRVRRNASPSGPT